MVKIIPFPRTHLDFTYNAEKCVRCENLLSETDEFTEIINFKKNSVNYLCSKCSIALYKEDVFLSKNLNLKE